MWEVYRKGPGRVPPEVRTGTRTAPFRQSPSVTFVCLLLGPPAHSADQRPMTQPQSPECQIQHSPKSAEKSQKIPKKKGLLACD